jgi:hypothetical protein
VVSRPQSPFDSFAQPPPSRSSTFSQSPFDSGAQAAPQRAVVAQSRGTNSDFSGEGYEHSKLLRKAFRDVR